jgi:nitroreductase
MELMDAIMTTRAIRRFTDEPVTDEEIGACLKAAVQAPSGGNIQPWQFLVVRDPEIKRKIGEIYLRAWNRYRPAVQKVMPPPRDPEGAARLERIIASSQHLADHFGEAPALVAFLMPNISMILSDDQGPMDTGTPYASVFPAVQNFILAARGIGIGTTLTSVYRIHQEEVRAVCDIPENFEVVAILPMGRPKGRFGVAPRRPAEAVTHWDRFGNRRKPA